MSEKTIDSERGKSLIVVLTVATTVLVAITAGLQAEASLRASSANRASQFYAIKIAGELQRSGLQGNYDMGIFVSTLQDRMQSTILELTAQQMQSQGNTAAANAALLQAEVAQARAGSYQAASILYTDSRYAPASADGTPDASRYLTDLHAAAQDLLAKQNATSDEYNKYTAKSDAYTGVLTVLAIALFLFGLAQAVSPGLRWLFALFGVLGVVSAILWALTLLL